MQDCHTLIVTLNNLNHTGCLTLSGQISLKHEEYTQFSSDTGLGQPGEAVTAHRLLS